MPSVFKHPDIKTHIFEMDAHAKEWISIVVRYMMDTSCDEASYTAWAKKHEYFFEAVGKLLRVEGVTIEKYVEERFLPLYERSVVSQVKELIVEDEYDSYEEFHSELETDFPIMTPRLLKRLQAIWK